MSVVQHLLLIRHGETVGNLEQIAHGRTESPLNERGIAQARRTAEMLQGREPAFHRIYTSPLSRARDTAELIADCLQLPVDTHAALIEASLGDLEGATYRQLEDFGFAQRSIRDDDFRGHNGESPNQLGNRVEAAVAELRARHPEENLILVSHGAAIAHCIARLMGTRPAFGHQYLMHNSAVTEITFERGRAPALTALNDYSHLPEHLKAAPTRRDQHV